MTTESSIKFQIACLNLSLATVQATKALSELAQVFEDRDSWHAVCEGEWPDKFTLLNRFVRTGVRPPFILND